MVLGAEAAQVKVYDEYERFLNGDVNFKELIDLANEAITEHIYSAIVATLASVYNSVPASNRTTGASFDATELDKIITVVRAYGQPTIYGTAAAIAQIPLTQYSSEADKLDVRNQGYVGMYKGCKVVLLENSYVDNSNTTKVLNDQFLYVIPEGKEKIIKVGLIGDAISRQEIGQDWTQNFEVYQKFGVAVAKLQNIGIMQITSL